MLRNILLIMSLTGSITVGLYVLTYPFSRKYFPLAWRYSILKMALFFYLVPVARLKFVILKIIYSQFPSLQPHIESNVGIVNNSFLEFSHNGQGVISPKLMWFWTFILILMIIAFCNVIRQLIKYKKAKKICLEHSIEPPNEWKEQFIQLKEKSGIKKNVRFKYSEYCKSPITIGVFTPTIVFPILNDIDKTMLQYMMKHELIHIKHRDLLVKFLGLLTIAVHWFNPMAYVLYHELCAMSEMVCDDNVIFNLNETERKKYGALILDYAEQSVMKNTYSVGLITEKKTLKRRIIEMKQRGKRNVTLSIIASALICSVSAGTALAYTPANEVDINGYHIKNDYAYAENGNTNTSKETIPYEHYFVGNDGTIYNATGNNSNDYVLCFHEFKEGTITEHEKKDDGGCEKTYMEGFRCIFCGYIKSGDILKIEYYPKCPH